MIYSRRLARLCCLESEPCAPDLKPQPIGIRVLRPFVSKQQTIVLRRLFNVRHIQHDVIQTQRPNQCRLIDNSPGRHLGPGKPSWNAEELKLDAVGVANHSNATRALGNTTRLQFLLESLSVVTIDKSAVMIDARRRALLPVRAYCDVADSHRHVIAQRLTILSVQ